MKIIHTSDWHLGHSLHGQPRDYEHGRFLDWLVDTLESEETDALLVSGDLFDSANPPASAQAAWYGFIARVKKRLPNLDLVLVGGNHDSPARLEAPGPLLGAMNVHVVGSLPRLPGGSLDLDRLVAPLKDRDGHTAALVAAAPFLRPADLPLTREEGADHPAEGVRRVYAEVLDAARSRLRDGQALIAMGHLYMTGSKPSELSERKILGGGQHALPADLFGDGVTYGALGHLHLAQTVGGRDNLRYSGSPIPLSLAEASYRHQVCLVELEGERLCEVRAIPVPRRREMLRIPADAPRPLADVVSELKNLDLPMEVEEERRPCLEARVLLDKPEPALRAVIEEALQGKGVRLLKISVRYAGDGGPLGEGPLGPELGELREEEVFRELYRSRYNGEPPSDLRDKFLELLDEVRRGDAP